LNISILYSYYIVFVFMLVSTNTIRALAGEYDTDMNMIQQIRIHIIFWPALVRFRRSDSRACSIWEIKLNGNCVFNVSSVFCVSAIRGMLPMPTSRLFHNVLPSSRLSTVFFSAQVFNLPRISRACPTYSLVFHATSVWVVFHSTSIASALDVLSLEIDVA
jgi:hypothetical protein